MAYPMQGFGGQPLQGFGGFGGQPLNDLASAWTKFQPGAGTGPGFGGVTGNDAYWFGPRGQQPLGQQPPQAAPPLVQPPAQALPQAPPQAPRQAAKQTAQQRLGQQRPLSRRGVTQYQSNMALFGESGGANPNGPILPGPDYFAIMGRPGGPVHPENQNIFSGGPQPWMTPAPMPAQQNWGAPQPQQNWGAPQQNWGGGGGQNWGAPQQNYGTVPNYSNAGLFGQPWR